VSLGALGVISTVTLRTVPAYNIRSVQEPTLVDVLLDSFDERCRENDHFEFFWWPHTEWAQAITNTRTQDPPTEAQRRAGFGAYVNDILIENHAFGLIQRAATVNRSWIPRLAGFTGLTPGSPEKIRSVVFDDRPPGGEVELDLESGAIVTEVKGGINTGFFGKMIGPNGQVTEVAVGGSTGYWITGAESIFVYQDGSGQFRSDELRRSGDTLVFVRNGVIVRIEGAKNQADALRIAGLVR